MTVNSWIPPLPDGWQKTTLRRMGRIFAGGTPDRKNESFWSGGDIPWLNSGAVNQGTITHPTTFITEQATMNGATRWVAPKSVLVALAGQGKTKGTSARTEIGSTFNQSLAAIEPNDNLDYRYLHYWIQSNYQNVRNLAGGDLRDGLNLDHIGSIELPLPPREVQRHIADYLDHETAEIDALIVETRALMDTVALRRRSLIDHVFMAAEWPAVALKYRGELRSGLTLGKTRDSDTHSYPYLRVANVQVGRVDLDEIATIDLSVAEAERYRLHKGDVLMTEGGDRDKLGRGAIWDAKIETILHQNHVFAFRCGSLLYPEFLVYGLEATPARVYFDQTARQSTNLASTNSTVVKNFRLPMPPLEEQRTVVRYLNHELTYMSDMVTNAKKIADLARERRAALITAAVTGQIDVTARNKPAAEQLEDDIAQGLHREN